MKIILKSRKHNIVLHLPLGMIKTKLLKTILNNNDVELIDKISGKLLYKSLKQYIKANGHFVFLSVKFDTEIIKIIV